MRIPWTVSAYIGRQFLFTILGSFAILISIIGVMELVELVRRAGHKEHTIGFSIILEMALMKLPNTAEKTLPFAVLVGSMVAFTRLTRNNELMIVRAAGVSIWQFLLPAIAVVMLIGTVAVAIFNPLSAAMISRFEQLEGKYITEQPSVLSVSASGLWLRQIEDTNMLIGSSVVKEYIMHAKRISQSDMVLSDITIFLYTDTHQFLGRIDASQAALKEGAWEIRNAIITSPGRVAKRRALYGLKTSLSVNQIQDSFASPKTLSFWELPSFINTLEKAGFSALRHKLHWHAVLASPVLLMAMTCLAAIFSMRLPRRGQAGLLLVAGVFIGFMVNFATNLIYALGLSGSVPIVFAAWSPALVTSMLGVASLLHLEDG